LNLNGISCFPFEKKPKIIAISIKNGISLKTLAKNIKKIFKTLFPLKKIDQKPFKAHVTIARVKQTENPYLTKKNIAKIINNNSINKNILYKTFQVDRFYLMESILTGLGPVYFKVAEFEV
jgi:2'-5' RNA ligase